MSKLTRILVILGLAVVLPLPAFAQEGVGIGAKVGPLFSSLDQATSSSKFENRTGIIGGLFIGGNRGGTVGVGVDVLYARKGAKSDVAAAALDLDYLNVPVYMRVNIGSRSTGGVSVYGTVGADLNFLLKAKATDGGTVLTDNFSRADYGISAGLGVEITRVILEGRYSKGLGNIAKSSSDPELKTQSFALMIGVRFN
jgi:hypothetical protein